MSRALVSIGSTVVALLAACSGSGDKAPAPVTPPPNVSFSDIGELCTSAADCVSGLCVPLTNGDHSVCTQSCTTDASCTAGWTCTASQCRCGVTTEVCDGKDNDCDGVIDNPPDAGVCRDQ